MRERLLGPGETLFWLLAQARPFNIVAVAKCTWPGALPLLQAARMQAFPVAVPGADGRPRWRLRPAAARIDVLEAGQPWLPAAQALLEEPLGGPDQPAWVARWLPVSDGSGCARLLLACPHALADWRSMHWLLERLLRGLPCDRLAPPCEEQLEPRVYRRSNAQELLDAWYADPLRARWQMLGASGLQAVLPSAGATVLHEAPLDVAPQRLREWCRQAGCAPGPLIAAVAHALYPALTQAAFAIDVARLSDEPAPAALGLALSHVTLQLPGRMAAALSAALRKAIAAGEPADRLLLLPDALMGRTPDSIYERAPLAVTGYRPFNQPTAMPGVCELACFSSARAGGQVLTLAMLDGSLRLVLACPTEQAALDVAQIAQEVARLVREAPTAT